MEIAKVELFRYTLPFKSPVRFAGEPLSARTGLVLRLTDKGGQIGLGECAPLPRYSLETLDQAERQLATIARRVRHVDFDLVDPLASAQQLFDGDSCASVRFATESAFLTLAAAVGDQPPASVLSPDFLLEVPINALIENTDNMQSRLAELSGSGARAVKLKVARMELSDDILFVRTVRESLPEDISLRLDANRRWDLDQASQFVGAIGNMSIDYIEEPLRDPVELLVLHERFPELPIAYDESVRDLDIAEITDAEHISAVIIKPTVAGGLLRALELHDACQHVAKKPIFGSALESSLGLQVIAHLASSQLCDTPIGLDTVRLFARDLIAPPLQVSNFMVSFPAEGYRSPVLCGDLITEVPLG